MTKSCSWDVLGTSFNFTPAIEAIDKTIGPRLRAIGVDPKTLFFSWFYAAQRDFTYTSIAGSYTPIAKILQMTLRRACLIVDLPEDQAPTDDEIKTVMKAVTSLPPRPGLKDCLDGLREAGWDVYAVTNGGRETSLNYYNAANIDLDSDHLLTCDEIKVAKPAVKVYDSVNSHLDQRGLSNESGDRWFVAAHAWDLIAARKAGFKTAYLTFEEHDPVTDLFGLFDIYADSMQSLLAQMKKL